MSASPVVCATRPARISTEARRTGWFTVLRFYGPTQAFFRKRWKPGDVERAE